MAREPDEPRTMGANDKLAAEIPPDSGLRGWSGERFKRFNDARLTVKCRKVRRRKRRRALETLFR